MIPVFQGTILQGNILFHVPKQFKEYLAQLENNQPNGQPVNVIVEKWKDQRTLSQNRYYWGVVLKIISDDTGHEPEELHEFFKKKFIPAKDITVKGEVQTSAWCTHERQFFQRLHRQNPVLVRTNRRLYT
jgi:hypothetical protein